jgi:hypothetical protein
MQKIAYIGIDYHQEFLAPIPKLGFVPSPFETVSQSTNRATNAVLANGFRMKQNPCSATVSLRL